MGSADRELIRDAWDFLSSATTAKEAVPLASPVIETYPRAEHWWASSGEHRTEPRLLLRAGNTETVTKTLIRLQFVWHHSAVTQPTPKNLRAVLASFDEHWAPRTIALVNEYDVRVAKVRGDFPSHRHLETDEFFLVLSGELTIAMGDHVVRLGPGDTYVVPRGVRHQPSASEETAILLFEPSTTVNTGDRPGELTAPRVVVEND